MRNIKVNIIRIYFYIGGGMGDYKPQTLYHGGVNKTAKSRAVVHCIIQNIRRASFIIGRREY